MADQAGSANTAADKGKGKGAAEPEQNDTSMDVDDISSEEDGDEDGDDVGDENDGPVDEPDEDNMETIDPENILPTGRRTRGVKIDYAKAAEEMGPEEDEDDEDDDFEAPDEDVSMDEHK